MDFLGASVSLITHVALQWNFNVTYSKKKKIKIQNTLNIFFPSLGHCGGCSQESQCVSGCSKQQFDPNSEVGKCG